MRSSWFLPCLEQVLRKSLAQCAHFNLGPGAKAQAGLETQSTGGHLSLEVGVGPIQPAELRDDGFMDVERQIEAHEVGVFQGPEHGEPQAKAVLHAGIESGRVAYARGD